MTNKEPISKVPTNIITGFLGTGKTTAILNLLKNKPENERWAVLVNEFGEIGVDGSLFEGKHSENQNVFIREVPGGCMCCTAGLSMQIALNVLLQNARPDRLLIEPTGLGHPREVLEVLTSEFYQDVLVINNTITLVDARKLRDTRYTYNKIFNQQLAIADVIVGNKADQYQESDVKILENYVATIIKSPAEIIVTENGVVDFNKFEGESRGVDFGLNKYVEPAHNHEPKTPIPDLPIPEEGFLKAEKNGGGFKSVGWRFSPEKIFDRDKLFSFFTHLKAVERLKGVFITQEGIFGYNLATDILEEIDLDDCIESRVEIIAPKVDQNWESQLMSCITSEA